MRSPVLKCTNPKSSLSLAHCVPLPLPGPPDTKITKGGVLRSTTRFSSVSSETSTSMICFLFGGGGASTEKVMPSGFTPYSTMRFVRSGGANFAFASFAGAALGLFSASQRLSHLTAARPFGCTWHIAMSPRESSCCRVGSTCVSMVSASRLLRSMEAPADLRKRKSRTSSSSGIGSAPSSGKKKRTSRAAFFADVLPWTAFRCPSRPQRARMELGRNCLASFTASGPIICCHTVTASSLQRTITQQGPAQDSFTSEA
mmetsp:Transcript_103215/g.328299  ORF Transcript_103215/g.328299 Transcript_103215/m.328299 type:complete len:258 (+) Transcript_103215:2820-3593(+)